MIFRLIAGLSLSLCLLSSPAWADWKGKVVEVRAGGDTLSVVTDDNRNITLQLYGIDCPEPGQPFAAEAETMVYELVVRPDKPVIILEEKRTSSGRILATVILHDNTTLNARLLLAGLAWVYAPNCVDAQYCQEMIKLQNKAQQGRIGLWADDNPIPPWKWQGQ